MEGIIGSNTELKEPSAIKISENDRLSPGF
jgi:hypothetical protein